MIWWSVLAMAQTPCAAHSPAQWASQLAAARHALDELALARASVWLQAIEDAAPCLSEPVPLPLLRQHAELQTLRHLYEQEPEGIEAWARHREAVGPGMPWSVPSDHPVHRFVRAIEPGKVVTVGPAAPPKRGGVFVDGRWTPELSFEVGARHLVQVFDDGGDLVAGTWVTGAAIDARWVGTVPVESPPRWFDGPGAEAFQRPSWRAARRDTLRAYQAYLRKDPLGEHATEAKRRIDALRWSTYPATPAGAQAYLDDWPKGRHRADAEAILQHRELLVAIDDGRREALQLFLGRYPTGVYAAEAARRLEAMAWAAALEEDTAQAYARYRVRWPRGEHLEEARLAQEQHAWAAALADGRAGLRRYVQSWPDGLWADEARQALRASVITRLAVAATGDGDGTLHAHLVEAAAAEVRALGLHVVDTAGARDGQLTLTVEERDVGVRATRPVLVLRLEAGGHEVLLDELMLDPMPLDDAVALLCEALARSLRRAAVLQGH